MVYNGVITFGILYFTITIANYHSQCIHMGSSSLQIKGEDEKDKRYLLTIKVPVSNCKRHTATLIYILYVGIRIQIISAVSNG